MSQDVIFCGQRLCIATSAYTENVEDQLADLQQFKDTVQEGIIIGHLLLNRSPRLSMEMEITMTPTVV